MSAEFREALRPVLEKYDITEKRDVWELRCRKCRRGYALSRSKPPSAGNILALLNHFVAHEERGREAGERDA